MGKQIIRKTNTKTINITKLFACIIFSLLFVSASFPQTYQDDINPLSNSFTMTLEGGLVITKTDYNKSLASSVGKFSMDYLFSTNSRIALGLKLFAGKGTLKANGGADTSVHNIATSIKTPVFFIGLGPEFSFSIGKFCPYFFMGLSYLHFNPEDSTGAALPRNAAGDYKKYELNYNFEFGVKYLVSRHFSISAALAGHVSPHDYLDDLPNTISTGYHNDQFYTLSLGISYSFLSSKNEAPEEQVHEQEQKQVQEQEHVQVQDEDHDGVPDNLDKCPNTPPGVSVDRNGCPLDSDNDGVPDYLDKCQNTKPGVKVDSAGCEIIEKKVEPKPVDSDKDGVPDNLDKCPNTPYGVAVDSTGCPLDSDHDGVPDFLDKCPNTKPGVKVDSAGCEIIEKKVEPKPVDSDKDGVPDNLDKCPNTPYGVAVDSTGCPLDSDHDGVPDFLDKCPNTKPSVKVDSVGCEIVEKKVQPKPQLPVIDKNTKELTLNEIMGFEPGTTSLTADGKQLLDELSEIMKADTSSRWRIDGYSDNTGSSLQNEMTSSARANSVLNYLTSKGLKDSRFDVHSNGYNNPVTFDNTDYGKAQNRRVTLTKLAPVKVEPPKQLQPKEEKKEPEAANELTDFTNYNYTNDLIVTGTIFSDGKYFEIQLGSWPDADRANKQLAELKAAGYNAMIHRVQIGNGYRYRVRVGLFSTQAEAQDFYNKNFGH